MIQIENVVLIKINQSYKENMTPEELYSATSFSWVAKFEKTVTRDLQYYCAVYKNKIIEVYELNSFEEDLPRRNPPRFMLHGQVAQSEIRDKLLHLDVSEIHKGSGNPIKYTSLSALLDAENSIVSVEKNLEDLEVSEVFMADILPHIHSYLTSHGFLYSPENIANLYLSLRSKPFVILSGVSGTGKTKVVQLFAEAIGATQANGRYQLIPVRPDWSDSSDLLGYTDLKGAFIQGELTKMIIRATEAPEYPHFVVLDEMNLARVEHYLSEFLSIVESREKQGERILTAPLVHVSVGEGVSEKANGLPDNLYIIGTVNMDETTYPFSKKVLDRANSIEFNEINLTSFEMFTANRDVSPVTVHNKQFIADYVQLQQAYPQHQEVIVDVSTKLEQFNQQLQLIYAQVGYRVRDEICFYMIYNKELGLLSEQAAMDFCLMQKLLPRITGAGTDVEEVLKALFKEFAGVDHEEKVIVPSQASYPRSARKVQEMLKRLSRQGFTSFWIS